MEQWIEYLNSDPEIIPELRDIADKWPDTRSYTIDYYHLFERVGDLAERLVREPKRILKLGESAIQTVLERDQQVGINLRVKNLLPGDRRQLKDFDVVDLGRMVEFTEVLIKKMTENRPKLVVGVYECSCCLFRQERPQRGFHEDPPLECPKVDGGCGKRSTSTTFRLIEDESRFMNSQKAEIIDPPDTLQGPQQPSGKTLYIEDDLVGKFSLGDRVRVVAVWRGKSRGRGENKAVDYDTVLEAVHIENMATSSWEEMDITDEDRALFQKIKDSNPLDLMVRSIAPSIYGYKDVKTALCLAMFAGEGTINPDGSKNREITHVLLVGDPGTAKSKLIRRATEFSYRGIFVDSTHSTGTTLTAAAVPRDPEFGEGRMTIEAGPLVLADRGVLAIDELDKWDKSHQHQLLGPMESQVVDVAKGGIYTSFKARTTIIAAANPKNGTYDRLKTVGEQTSLIAPLINRFGLVIGISDKPDKTVDTAVADRIEANMTGVMDEASIPPYPITTWRKYIQEHRKIALEKNDPKATQRLKDIYVDIRSSSSERTISARQLEDLFRLASMSARLHGRSGIAMEDTYIAERLVRGSSAVATGAGSDQWGNLDELYTQMKRDAMGQIERFEDIISAYRSTPIYHQDLTAECRKYGVNDPDAMIKRALRDGLLMEPTTAKYLYVGA